VSPHTNIYMRARLRFWLFLILMLVLLNFMEYYQLNQGGIGYFYKRYFASEYIPSSSRFPSPQWSLKDTEGKTYSSENLKGQVVLINFWATWSTKSLDEFPALIDLQEKFKNNDVTILGVSIDQIDNEKLANFKEKSLLPYPNLVSDTDMIEKFGVFDSLPMTFLIDQNGNIVRFYKGKISSAELSRVIEDLLTPTSP